MISVEFPKGIEDQLRDLLGARLNDAVREAIVVEGFRASRLSIGQVAKLLDLTIDEANRLMLERGVEQGGPTLDEVEAETRDARERLGPGGRS